MFSLLDFMFLNMAFSLLVVGIMINTIEDYLPLFITQNFRYGKFCHTGNVKSSLKLSDLPKSYFKHFYVFATILVSSTFLYTTHMYYHGLYAPNWLISFINIFCGSGRMSTVNPATTVLCLFLLTIQCIRRFYETFCVQIFSKNSKINLSHYFVGHFHYFGCVLAILSRSVGYTDIPYDVSEFKMIDNFTLAMAIPAVFIFSFAWTNQFQSNKILANLRKDKKSKVVSEKYFMPVGGLFEYVSSPHLLCEILIYLSLTLLLINNISWLYVLAWVLSNQIETGLLSHWWYQKTFPKYPKQRKAIIPFML